MVVIRVEQPADISAIHAIHGTCFPTLGEARLVDLLRGAGKLSVSLVAEVDGRIVGHIAFSPVHANSKSAGIGLAPIAVIDSHRRQGVASQLIRSGFEACRQAGYGWAVVLGEPEYYERFGFRLASEYGLVDEYDGGDAFQALDLLPDSLPIGAGLVRYTEQFASLK